MSGGAVSDDPRKLADVRELFQKAMRAALEGRESHVKWLEHLEAGDCDGCTADVVATAGDADVHRGWVEKYDAIIEALGINGVPFLLEAVAKVGDGWERERRERVVQHALRYRAELLSALASLETAHEQMRRGRESERELMAEVVALNTECLRYREALEEIEAWTRSKAWLLIGPRARAALLPARQETKP